MSLRPKQKLARVFEAPLTEGAMPTAQVTSMPSGVSREIAAQAIESIDLTPVMRDIGIVLAREIANELQSMALRPADYINLPDMPQMVAARVAAELSTAPEPFLRAMLEHLKLRG